MIALALCAVLSAGVGSRLLFQPTVARGGCDADNSGYGYGYGPSRGYGYGYGPGDDGCDPDGTYIPVTPVRLLDGRLTPQVILGPNGTTDVQVTGVGGVPATGVAAVVLNLTVANPTAASFFQLFPTGGNTTTSSLNFEVNQTRASETTIKVGAGGKVTIRNFAGNAFPIVDLQGYYAAPVSPTTGSSYVPLLAPARALDTRGQPPGPFSRLTANEVRSFATGVPVGATAVVANFTAVTPTAGGFLTIYPDGSPQPLVSNVNFAPGRTIPNLSIIPVPANGRITVFNGAAGTTEFLIDVAGYFVSRTSSEVGDRFTPVDPARIGDSRASAGNIGGLTTFTLPNQVKNLQVTGVGGVPASNVSAVVVSITAAGVGAVPETFFTAFPAGTTPPLVSNLNPITNENAANLAIVRVGFGGAISLLNNRPPADMVIDVYGYFRSA